MQIDTNPSVYNDLFFQSLIEGYVTNNKRFLRRDWLAAEIDTHLADPACRFVLLTAEPGFGKSVLMAQLADDHPDWPRYFIRRDQRSPLADVGSRSFLLRIGYQLAARYPELFDKDAVRLSVEQRIGDVADRGTVVGAEIQKIVASPFHVNISKLVEIRQQVANVAGKVVGLRIGELAIEPHLLDSVTLQHMALIEPARAMQRLHPDRQIVILVDALDEIRYHQTEDNILKWLTNCPELPPNVHFVLSSRPPDDALKVFCEKQAPFIRRLALTPEDPQVQSDVQLYARRLATRPDVATELVQLNIDMDSFVTQAVDKANGNIGYLDAVERAIDAVFARPNGVDRMSLAALLKLSQLPNEFGALYGFFLHQIKASVARERIEFTDPQTGETYDKAVWPAVYHRILGVLAVALAPLRLDHIMALGGVKVGREYTIEVMNSLVQFLDTEQGGYRLYHATLPEFLTAPATREQAETTDLWIDASDWNQQIANHYWNTYHNDWSGCDDYGLNSLTTHLYRGNQFDRLAALINQAWMHARFNGGGYVYDGFITDVMLAWQHAHEEAVHQITAGKEPVAMADCVRFALIRTSINSLSGEYVPELVARALETELEGWTGNRALAIAFRVFDPGQRAKFLALLVSTHQLTGDQRIQALKRGLLAVHEIDSSIIKREVLMVLTPHLSAELAQQALKIIQQDILEEFDRAMALAALVPSLNEEARIQALQEVLNTAHNTSDSWHRELIMVALIPYLSGEAQKHALGEVLSPQQNINPWRAKNLTALAPYLSHDDSMQIFQEALLATQDIEDEDQRTLTLAELVPGLNENHLQQMIPLAYGIQEKILRGWILAKLVPRLSGEVQIQILREALQEGLTPQDIEMFPDNEMLQEEILTILLPFLSSKELEHVLQVKQGSSGNIIPKVLIALSSHLSGDRQIQVLQQALQTAQNIKDEEARWDALASLAPHLNGEFLQQGLQSSQDIRDKEYKVWALTALAPALNLDLLQQVLLQMQDVTEACRAQILVRVAPYLSEELLDAALQIEQVIGDEYDRALALTAIATYVSGDAAKKTLNQTLMVLQAMNNHLFVGSAKVEGYGRLQAESLTTLSHQLNGELLEQAMQVAQKIRDVRYRVKSLAILAPRLSHEARMKVLQHALDDIRDVTDENQRAESLVALVPQLSGALLEQAQALQQTLDATPAVTAQETLLLTRLVPDQIGKPRSEVLKHALQVIQGINSDDDKAWTLLELAPSLTEEYLAQALHIVYNISDQGKKAALLVSLSRITSDYGTIQRDAREAVGNHLFEKFTACERVTLLKFIARNGDFVPMYGIAGNAWLAAARARQFSEELTFVVNNTIFVIPIFDQATLATIAKHIIEITEKWCWL